MVILNCFYIPLLASFPMHKEVRVIPALINLYFILDILMTMRTAYYSKGLLITSSRKILRNTLRPWLLVDIIALVAGLFYLVDEDSQLLLYITFFTLLRAAKIGRYLQLIEDHFQFSRSTSGFLKLLKLVLSIFIVAHVGGCVFHIIAWTRSKDEPDTWLRLYPGDTSSVAERYVVSVYWAFTTMITVGYGDIVPTNFSERIYTIIIMVVAGGVFGYSLNTIGSIINEISEHSAYSRFTTSIAWY